MKPGEIWRRVSVTLTTTVDVEILVQCEDDRPITGLASEHIYGAEIRSNGIAKEWSVVGFKVIEEEYREDRSDERDETI